MKKKILLLIVIVLLTATAFWSYRYLSLPNYEVPFKAKEVKSITLSNIWEYKIVEEEDAIEEVIWEVNKISIASDYDESKGQIAEGTIGYSLYFELTDGRQLEYSAVPTQGLGFKFVDEEGNAYNARNFTMAKIWNSLDVETYPPIPSDIYSIFYQGEMHKGVATVMPVPSDAQLVGTVTGITYIPNCELECSHGKTGQNVYVWKENGVTKLGVEIEQDVWPETQAFTINIPNNDEPTSNAISHNWGITLETENVTSKGLTIVCHHSGGEDVFDLHTGSYYTLQKLEDEGWVDVEYLPQEYTVGWTAEAWNIQKENTTTWDVNWEWLYGELPAGEYRIGKEITNFRGTGDSDSEMIYADFIIK